MAPQNLFRSREAPMLFNSKTESNKQQDNQKSEIEPTESQRRILELLSNGCKQEQVAEALGIGYETVRTQLRLLRSRLKVNTLEQMIALAAKRGWVNVDDYPRLRN